MHGKCGFILGAILTNLLWFVSPALLGQTQTQTQPAPPMSGLQSEQNVKALGLLIQVVRNVETFVKVKELSSIHNEDMMLYSALTVLLEDSKHAPVDRKDAMSIALVEFGRKVADLHEAADFNNQVDAEIRVKVVSDSFIALKEFYDPDLLSRAETLADSYTCPMHPDVIGKNTDLCPKCGMQLDQSRRISLFRSDQMIVTPTTMKASIQTMGPLTPGVESTFYLRLRKIDGSPVLPTDLREVHTQKIHLLIVDMNLEDYHHLHPVPSDTPGSYYFSFAPGNTSTYRAFADVRSTLTGFQEYVMTEIPGSDEQQPVIDKTQTLKAESEGMKYELTFASKEIKVREPVPAKLRITKANGKPFDQLEPIMGAFAHIAGFNENRISVLHMHPKGGGLLGPTDRGGPELEFIMYAIYPGFYRLFVQIQVEGVSKFASFGITVSP